MRTRTRSTALAAAALVVVTTLAACAGNDDPEPDAAPVEEVRDVEAEEADEHNDADTVFTQMMIVHHEGALEMSELALARSDNEEVRDLAQRIADAQDPEIQLMAGWLTAWGERQPGEMDHAGMDHAGMDMDGMSQDEAMDALRELEGAEFDRMFLALMIAHHRGAIVMAEVQLADGSHPDARALAREIIDAQATEITEMENVLRDL